MGGIRLFLFSENGILTFAIRCILLYAAYKLIRKEFKLSYMRNPMFLGTAIIVILLVTTCIRLGGPVVENNVVRLDQARKDVIRCDALVEQRDVLYEGRFNGIKRAALGRIEEIDAAHNKTLAKWSECQESLLRAKRDVDESGPPGPPGPPGMTSPEEEELYRHLHLVGHDIPLKSGYGLGKGVTYCSGGPPGITIVEEEQDEDEQDKTPRPSQSGDGSKPRKDIELMIKEVIRELRGNDE